VSFLHPLFLAALVAVVVPVVLHLARRRTQRELPFSDLRFLAPVPPRLERRRRLEHWLLLLLRGVAVALLVGAFARPFFTRPLPGLPAASGRRSVLLLDVSASMRREGLWPALQARATAYLNETAPADRLAILVFDGSARWLVSFEHWSSLPASRRVADAGARLAALAPGWGETDLGAALVAAAEAVADDRGVAGGRVQSETVVLLGDLAEGARLGALGPAEWPAGLRLRVDRLEPTTAGDNLGLQLVPSATDGAPEAAGAAAAPGTTGAAGPTAERHRVRILPGSTDGQAGQAGRRAWLAWQDGAGSRVEVVLPAGEAPVLDAPARPAGPATLVLEGDAFDFDNRLAVAPQTPAASRILYAGNDDAKDATASLYFLSRAFPVTRTRAPQVEALRPDDPALPAAIARADLVVMTEAVAETAAGAARAFLQRGRALLFVPRNAETATAGLGALAGTTLAWREAPAGQEAILTQVDLRDPLLAPFADGRASDFTRVRFWKRRVVDAPALPPATRVLARFDDGSPAWLVWPTGRGLLFMMTSGFSTGDSQLALSSKLVPLLWSLLDASTGTTAAPSQFVVGERIPLPGAAEAITVHTPDGRALPLVAAARFFDGADQPGLYRFATAADPASGRVVAVNVSPLESATAPLPLEHLERAGIPVLEGAGSPAQDDAVARQAAAGEAERRSAFFAELEGQQKPWRWVLLAVLLVLLAETLLARRAARIQRLIAEQAP
jgi:hypothetical protein